MAFRNTNYGYPRAVIKMFWQLGEYRIKHGNRAVVLDYDPNSAEPIIGKVLSNKGWSMQWWYANGSYYGDKPSQWDLTPLTNPVPETGNTKPETPEVETPPPPPKQDKMLVTPEFLIAGKRVYLYTLKDAVHSGAITPLRVSRNPSYGQGFVRLDAVRPLGTSGEEFEFTIENPVYDNRE